MNTNGKQSSFSQLPLGIQQLLKSLGADETNTTVHEFGGDPTPAAKPEPTPAPAAKAATEQSGIDPLVTDILAMLGYGAKKVGARAKELVGNLCQTFADIKEELSKEDEMPLFNPLDDWEKGVIIGRHIATVNAAEVRNGRKPVCNSEGDYLSMGAFVLSEADRCHVQDKEFSCFALRTIVSQRPMV